MFSIGHGLNDSQKVMGIIAAAMIAAHSEGIGMGIHSINDLPDWVAFACFTAISLGTMSGGWKIVKTMGTRITKVTPLEGVIAETAGAFTLYLTEYLKIPVSTTHRSHHRCRSYQTALGGTLGGNQKPDDGLGTDHSGKCLAGCSHLPDYQLILISVRSHQKRPFVLMKTNGRFKQFVLVFYLKRTFVFS